MLPLNTTISASQINTEFGRSSTATFSMFDARNGNYGAINNASGFRPTANGQSGYEWNDWWGYNHCCLMPDVRVVLYEPYVGVNIRFYVWDAYGVNIINEFWYYSNTNPSSWPGQSLSTDSGVTIRTQNDVQVLWNPDYWGSGNIYKQIFSGPGMGYIYNLYEDAYIQRLTQFQIQPVCPGKFVNSNYYVNGSPDSLPY